MKESYTKGIATHSDPELCVCLRKVSGEALTGAHKGVLLSRVNKDFGAPTLLLEVDRLQGAFYSLKRKAAPGVADVTW